MSPLQVMIVKKQQLLGKSPFATTWEGSMIYDALQNNPIEMNPAENICVIYF